MALRLVDSGWDCELSAALRADRAIVRMVCPFIKRAAAERVLAHGQPGKLQVVTRFKLADFACGVSDTSALRLLLGAGARIRGIRDLHAKLYLLGTDHAIITSANLTERGLLTNHELGVVTDDAELVAACLRYFKQRWKQAGPDLTTVRLDAWDEVLAAVRARGGRPSEIDLLPDEGTDVGPPPDPIVLAPAVEEAGQRS